jgi:type I restriction enzyme M protein
MIGAIIGDIVGSPYDFNNIKTKDFELLGKRNRFTDDTVMTVAVAETLLKYEKIDINNVEEFQSSLIQVMKKLGKIHLAAGFGAFFFKWLMQEEPKPYNSFGNGSAMRVSPVAWYAKTLEETAFLAKATSEITHNHPEGIKGAVSVAGATFLAKNGALMEEIKAFVAQYYTIDFSLDEIRETYKFDCSCQGSIPQAFEAFFESTSFEDAIRNAVSIGGDSDTIAAITGSIAEAYYGVDEEILDKAKKYLTPNMQDIIDKFDIKYKQ